MLIVIASEKNKVYTKSNTSTSRQEIRTLESSVKFAGPYPARLDPDRKMKSGRV
jgi:hypothetical protein